MKKFTFLLSLLLAFAGVTASAQDSYTWKKLSANADLTKAVTDLGTLQDGGTYAFYSVSQKKYIKIDKYDLNNLHFGNIAELSTDNEDAGLGVFTFHITKSGEQTLYSFESAVNGYYMPVAADNNGAGGTSATKTDKPATFVISTTDTGYNEKDGPVTKKDGSFVIKNSGDNMGFDMTPGQFCGWYAAGSNCWYKIVPVTVSENDNVTVYNTTHTVKEGDKICATYSEWIKNGSTISAHNFVTPYYYSIDKNITDWTISSTNHDFVYTATKTNESPISTDKTYAIKINGNRYFTAVKDNGTWRVNTLNGDFNATAYDVFASKCWKFVESGWGVKIYNPLIGKYIKVNGGAAVSLDNEGTVMYFAKNGTSYALSTSTANQYLNSSIDYNGANNRLGTWTESSISGGSTFNIQDVDATEAILALGKTSLSNSLTIAKADADKYLTFDTSVYETAKNNVESATTVEALNAIYSGIVTPAVTPDEAVYYRIKSVSAADGNAYLSTGAMFVGKDGKLSTSFNGGKKYDEKNLDRTITRTTNGDALVPQIWRFVKTTENSYQLKNVNTRCNSAFFANGNLDMPVNESYGQSITLKPALTGESAADNSYVSIVFGDNLIGIRGDNYYGTTANAASEKVNIWQIEKVTNIPVSITDAKYATVAFPFATKVTTNSVKAYYATSAADGMITLVEYPEGIIPANEGALLFNKAGATTANLEIVTTENTVKGNKLLPATAKRAGFTANSTYVLAKNAANEAAFLKNGLTVVPANKAYIDAETIPNSTSSNELNFNFGQTTGINGVVAADKAGVQYFDLQGRRVLYPAHGIFVTNTGKKVFVK